MGYRIVFCTPRQWLALLTAVLSSEPTASLHQPPSSPTAKQGRAAGFPTQPPQPSSLSLANSATIFYTESNHFVKGLLG